MKTQNQCYLDAITEFAQSIGLECLVDNTRLTGNEFVPYVMIENGTVVFDYNHAQASDLIHELGHLALIPKSYRMHMDKNIYKGLKLFISEAYASGDMDVLALASACEDSEATAWAWAAGKHLGIPEELIIEDHQYVGKGADLRLMLSLKSYSGISSLRNAKYTCTPHFQVSVPDNTLYPNMVHWTADQVLRRN